MSLLRRDVDGARVLCASFSLTHSPFPFFLLSSNKRFHSLDLDSPFFAPFLSSSLWSSLIPLLPLPFPNFFFLFLLLSVLPSVPLPHPEPGQYSVLILKDTFPNSTPSCTHPHTCAVTSCSHIQPPFGALAFGPCHLGAGNTWLFPLTGVRG